MTRQYCDLVNSAYNNHEHSESTVSTTVLVAEEFPPYLYSFQLYSLDIMDPLSIEIPQASGDTEG